MGGDRQVPGGKIDTKVYYFQGLSPVTMAAKVLNNCIRQLLFKHYYFGVQGFIIIEIKITPCPVTPKVIAKNLRPIRASF